MGSGKRNRVLEGEGFRGRLLQERNDDLRRRNPVFGWIYLAHSLLYKAQSLSLNRVLTPSDQVSPKQRNNAVNVRFSLLISHIESKRYLVPAQNGGAWRWN